MTDVPSLSAQYSGDRRTSAWRSEFCTRRPCLSTAQTDHTVREPAPPSLWTINGARLWNVQFLTCAPAGKKFLPGTNARRELKGQPQVPSSYLGAPHQHVQQLSRSVQI